MLKLFSRSLFSIVVCFLFVLTFSSFSSAASTQSINDRLSKVAKHVFTDDRIQNLSEDEQKLFYHLIQAGEIMDDIYLDQMHPMNQTWVAALKYLRTSGNETAAQALDYFFISYGPWGVFMQDEWLLPENLLPQWVPTNVPRLSGYNLYPYETKDGVLKSISMEELDNWLKKHPEKTEVFKNPFTVIRRTQDGKGFVAIPYAEYYKDNLEKAAWHLEQAALYAKEKSVQELLKSRAKAFRTNEFRETETFWVNTHDADIQVLIGPYEESIDEIWGVKRGFGSRIGFKDPEGTADLQTYKSLGPKFQANLPIDAKYHPDRQKEPFFTVWNSVYTSGESRKGAQTLGQKLTNDRKFTIEHGARQNFYRNSQNGKCEKILKPISKIVLAKEYQADVSCDSFFKGTLHHENAHALGIAFWYPDWDNPDPKTRQEVVANMPQWGVKLEELKADTLGLYNRQYMLDEKLEDPSHLKQMYATMIAGFFRSVRFGMHSSYAMNAMIMLNHLADAGALIFDPKKEGRVQIVAEKVPAVLKQNARDALMLQVKNDDKAVGDYYKKWAVIRPETKKLLDRISKADVPRDLYPIFPIVKKLEQ